MSAVYQLPDGTDARLTERVMLDWLRRRYTTVHGNGPRWVYATHVPDAPGFAARRTADAVAMDMWNSKGLELHGHEVKVSRSDWLRELREPEKATAVGRYCDRWWLVVPDLAIVKPGELPDDWGLLLCTSAGVQAVEPARKRIPVPVDKGFMAAMARAVAKTASYYVAPEQPGDTVQAPDVAEVRANEWGQRFRAAADAANVDGFHAVAAHLSELSELVRLPGRVEAIGRALLGTDTTPEAGGG